jgi:hypothetical protein
MFPIASWVNSGTPTSTVTFNNIPQQYTHLQIRVFSRINNPTGDNWWGDFLNFNGDMTNTNYNMHQLSTYRTSGGAVAIESTSTSNQLVFNNVLMASSVSTSIHTVSICDLLDYTNTNKTKVLRTLSGFDENNASGNTGAANIQLSSVLWNSTSAVTSIEFTNSGNFAQYSSFALYGIK